ncbi:MAG: hypothetical protein OEV91_02345 [Desulfobulbaceae bacterium]|nr:hypothetical protein [Desulfobulbaceae bacterium]
MSEEVKCIPYELALKIVGNVIEEEHLHEANRRILTVYDKKGRELCWFDAEELLAEVGPHPDQDAVKTAAVERVLRQIPEWAVEDLLKEVGEGK